MCPGAVEGTCGVQACRLCPGAGLGPPASGVATCFWHEQGWEGQAGVLCSVTRLRVHGDLVGLRAGHLAVLGKCRLGKKVAEGELWKSWPEVH